MITITEVKTKKDWKTFATFATNLYKGNPHYVPAFISDDRDMANPKKNPNAQNALVKAFLAHKDGKVVGRIAGIILQDSELEEDKKLVIEDILLNRAGKPEEVASAVRFISESAKFMTGEVLNLSGGQVIV